MRYITVFCEQGHIDWQFHISENKQELVEVLFNLKDRALRVKHTYELGKEIDCD